MSPHSAQMVAELMAAQNSRGKKVSAIDLRQMNRVIELAPEDMTVAVEAGMSLDTLQRELKAHGQWLPIDPPHADQTSIHEILSKDLSGPRRFGCGTIRDHLIGMKVVLADGRTIKSGGKVVKNVAGYDLAKLFIGARDSLGIIVEATFKLRPLPEMEQIVCAQVELAGGGQVLRAIMESDLTPVIMDAYRAPNGKAESVWFVLGFAGTREEVEWQLGIAQTLGLTAAASLEHEIQFWTDAMTPNRASVLPSRIVEVLNKLGSRPFVARTGNGVIYFRGEPMAQKTNLPNGLMRRVKMAYDPNNILPELVL